MARRKITEKAPNELDIKIIKQLQIDARRPFTAIAEELGLPESTVRKRVDRLEATGILQFTGFADPLRLGFQYWSYIAVKVELSALEHTANAVAPYHEVFFVGITTGEYNLFVAAVFRSNADLLHFLNERLSKFPGVIETATSNVLRIFKRTAHLFQAVPSASRSKLARPEIDEEPEVSQVDLRIMAALQTDGRKSFAQVASQLDISESTVHNRVQRLRQLGILQFEAYADPLRLGYVNWVFFQFRVEARQSPALAARLTQFPELFFVGATTGLHDIHTTAAFRSNEDVLTFLRTKVAALSWIKSVTITYIIKPVKRQLVYPLTADGKTNGIGES